jgi:hypothetical protein
MAIPPGELPKLDDDKVPQGTPAEGGAEGVNVGAEGIDAQLVNPGALPSTLAIDMVEIGKGCAGDCLSCGAFKGIDVEDRRVKPITIEQLEANITQTIEDQRTGTKVRLIDLFRSIVTSGVDMEPLAMGIFNEAAELINNLSGGKSKLVAISHGISCIESVEGDNPTYVMPRPQVEKLQRLNELMLQDVVPLFVLSMDSARAQGIPGQTAAMYHQEICEMEKRGSYFMKIVQPRAEADQRKANILPGMENPEDWEKRVSRVKSVLIRETIERADPEATLTTDEVEVLNYVDLRNKRRHAVVEMNARGYAATLYHLMPAIKAGKMVTVSLQGVEDKESLAYQGLARRIFQRTTDLLREEYGVSNQDIQNLAKAVSLQLPRAYVGVGRAQNLLGVKPGKHCTVVPDPDFVRSFMDSDPYKVSRGRIRGNGTLEVQMNRPGQEYDDTVDPNSGNPWAVVNLTKSSAKAVGPTPVAVATAETTLGRKLVIDE